MSDMDARISPVSLQKYVIQFAGLYVLCNIAIFAITTLFNFDAPSSMGIVTLIASTAPVMQSFVKREQRVPSSRERVLFASMATAASLILSAVLAGIMLAVYQLNPLVVMDVFSIPAWAILATVVFAIVLTWVVIYFFSGFMAKQTLKQIEKAKLKER